MQPEVMSRLPHVRGPGWDRWSLHIAGLNNTGYATRLHRMGPAGRPGLEQVEGSLRDQACTGRIKMCRYGIVPFRAVTARNPSELYTDPQLELKPRPVTIQSEDEQ